MILTATIVGKSQQTYTHGEMLGYNIGFSTLNEATGYMINKSKEEKLGKAFWKGFYKGAIGGCVVYGSKQMVYQFEQKENYNMLWSACIVDSVGNSMVQNALPHYGMLD